MARSRRPAFVFITVMVGLVLCEAAARGLESLSPKRSLPLPIPGQVSGAEAAALSRKMQAARAQLPPIPLVPDETSGWALPAGAVGQEGTIVVRYNALGLRGPELGERSDGEERLLTLGDSSIYGQAVAENQVFSSVAADLLGKAWGRPVTPVIGGVPGYSSDQSLLLLKKLGARVEPTWVIIGSLWSDVYAKDARDWERTRSFLSQFASYRLLLRGLTPLLSPQKVGYMDGREDVGALSNGPPPRTPLSDYRANLQAMVEETRKIGAKPAFLILPAPLDFDTLPPPETVLAYRNVMRDVATEAAAPIVDGPALFVSHGATVAYFGDQVHPNGYGHRLLGELLAEQLEKP